MIRTLVLICFLAIFYSCTEKKNTDKKEQVSSKIDTILVKKKNKLEGFNEDYMTKSYSYYWVTVNDTADIVINAYERKEDNTLHLVVDQRKMVLFNSVIDKLNQSIPKIKEDFDWTKIGSIFLNAPVYYPDLANALSKEYEQKFGRKAISYEKLNQFLLQSSLNTQLNNFLNPFDKKTESYGIEKFHFLEKKDYSSIFSDSDLSVYPEFTLHGMGIYVQITTDKSPK
ncbi:hypothetical protein LZQ00_10335 [Sphingobacterium sp. SRCM116780]|uniref:hypothetical protein n=1 Tax=Sphingobacterium sp. SRCM116780 TaxID=2907623 RepID=UPI001F30BDBC|nr:hypothetical protein [Sphingobacterium sp. SRCM116780]UIR54673.1 hypothetical protein LZQ00_10335 [Sphingobacterium sp. SRCM116780]